MKKTLLNYSCLIATIAIIGMSWSCTKENASVPPPQQSSPSSDEPALRAGEVAAANVAPGNYTVFKFIDTGDDITSDYNGYTFKFRADGVLIATTRTGTKFNGTWKLIQQQTKMAIDIHGTRALKNLSDDSWNVVSITNLKISLKKPGPDRVIFVM